MNPIPCPLYSAARKHPYSPAIIGPHHTLTFQELTEQVDRISGWLAQRGVQRRDVIAISSTVSTEYVVFLFALWRIGAVAFPLNPHLPRQYLRKSCARWGVKHRFTRLPKMGAVKIAARPDQTKTIDLNQPATIIMTSGSSAEPKAAMHTFGNHYYNAKGANQNIPLGLEDRWLLSLPLYHVGGLAIVFRTILAGAACVIPDEKDIPTVIARHRVTHLSLVPTQLQRLLQKPLNLKRLSSLKTILLGGSGISPDLLKRSRVWNLPVFPTYGLTEMSSQVATGRAGSPNAIKALSYRQIKIAPDKEILVKGKTLFKGYWDGKKTRLPLKKGGWFATGDLGEMDHRGSLAVYGRKDKMFISGGENIQPEEIEKALLQHAKIIQAVVVPIADKEFGHRPAAFVRFYKAELSATQVRRHLEKIIPRFKIPVIFYFWREQGGLKPGRKQLAELVASTKTSLRKLS